MPTNLPVPAADLAVLRQLGERQAQLAESAANQEKIEAWYRHDAGHPERRPMVLAEVDYLRDRVRAPWEELRCTHAWARQLERRLRLRHYEIEVLGDDHVALPWVEYGPVIHATDYGVPGGRHRQADADPLAHNYQPPLTTLDADELARLQPRHFTWDRAAEDRERERLAQAFAGVLPVRRRCQPWQLFMPLTSVALEFVGMDGFMTLLFDNPDGLHHLMGFLRDDYLAQIDWLDREGVWPLDNEADYVGAGSMGYTRDLPRPDSPALNGGPARASDRWFLSESQESVGLSPDQYAQFVFPYLAALAARFGKVYYGCCEPADPLLDSLESLPNLARVSVSAWADEERLGAFCRRRGVAYSRKPSPNFFMAPAYDLEAVRAHLDRTVDCARGCRLEIIQRDVYVTAEQPGRFVQWVELARQAAARHRATA